MTPEQKDRIRTAAVELGAALSWVGADFDTEIRQIICQPIECKEPTYIYTVRVTLNNREVIA